MRFWMSLVIMCVACGESTTTDAGAGDSATDAPRDAGCEPVTCEIACPNGFLRDSAGCEICECAPAPDDSCTEDDECVIARDVTGCCGCEEGHSRVRVTAETCLVERGDDPLPGCLPDPEMCAVIDCAACAPVLRAICMEGTCRGSDECGEGEVPFRLGCLPACESHADCTLAADYGICCGGCTPVHRSFDEGDACWAERQSDSSCAPAPGSCDGLGCPSPPTDCLAGFGSAVCMSDGTCNTGGPSGECPSGSSDVDGVCVPD